MKYRPRIYYTESQKVLMWERWRKGESLQQIAQLFDRNHTSIQGILARTGGIQPRPRCRSQRALSWQSGRDFQRACRGTLHPLDCKPVEAGPIHDQPGNQSQRRSVRYRASQTEQAAWDRASRPKPCKLAENRHWLPWSRTSFGCSGHRSRLQAGSNLPTPATRITRCRTRPFTVPYIQARGALKKELLAHLRRTRAMRRSRHHTED